MLLLALLLNPVLAQCAYLQVTAVANATVMQGSLANFPIIVKNQGTGAQNVYVSGTNPFMGAIETSFDQSFATLAPSQDGVFTFSAYADSADPGVYEFPIEVATDIGSSTCTQGITLILTVKASGGAPVDPGEVKASIYPTQLKQLFPGEKAEYQISIYNHLDETVIASIDTPSNPLDSSTSLSESDMKLAAGESRIVKASITLPPGAPKGDFETVFRVQVTSGCCVKEFLLPVTIRSNSKAADLRILEEPLECITVKHGERKFLELGVRNDGDIKGPYSLNLVGDDSSLKNVKLPLRLFELNPGEREYYNISVFPNELVPIDTYRFTVQAKYLDFLLFEKELCYNVEGISNVEVQKPLNAQVSRCETDAFQIKIRNAGTIRDEYAIEARPLLKATPYVEPEVFKLSPGEQQIVNYIVQTTCKTPLGRQLAAITVRPRLASAVTSSFNVQVVSNASSAASPLKLEGPSKINAVEGETKRLVVNVQNTGTEDLVSASVEVLGLPKDWVFSELPKTIKAGKTAPFYVLIRPAKQGSWSIKFEATSGDEKSSFDSQLLALAPTRQIVSSFDVSPISENGITKEVFVKLTIRNIGNLGLSDISVRSRESDINLIPQGAIQSLPPGASADLAVKVEPLKDTPQKDVSFEITSDGDVLKIETIGLPALQRIGGEEEFPWRLVIIGILLILIFWLLARQAI